MKTEDTSVAKLERFLFYAPLKIILQILNAYIYVKSARFWIISVCILIPKIGHKTFILNFFKSLKNGNSQLEL